MSIHGLISYLEPRWTSRTSRKKTIRDISTKLEEFISFMYKGRRAVVNNGHLLARFTGKFSDESVSSEERSEKMKKFCGR